jgi:hypothetical protein
MILEKLRCAICQARKMKVGLSYQTDMKGVQASAAMKNASCHYKWGMG